MVTTLLLALGVSVCAVIAAVLFIMTMEGRSQGKSPKGGRLDRDVEPLALLFRNNKLVDGTAPARALLDLLPGEGEWQRLMAWVSMRLPEAGDALAHLEEDGRIEIGGDTRAGHRRLRVLIEQLDNHFIRVTLNDPTSENAGIVVDSLTLSAMEEELEMLRNTMDRSPMLAWREDADGMVTWANSAYIQIAERQAEGQTVWPLPRLIDLPVRAGSSDAPRRAQIEDRGQTLWYECHGRVVGDHVVGMALPADTAVRAERSLRDFVHTLTKTFADLPIGLAIFDRDRRLQLFNPSLIDLTTLSAGFLTARPTLYAFLDRLREARMVPEPKDYRSWRNRMSSLETAAASGHHVETWSLPGGQTYRVTGRPHPDGAIAFLFEDITSEISLTRKFRADLSLNKEVLDTLANAVAVFDSNGMIAMSNRGYGELWGTEIKESLADHLGAWREQAGDGPGLKTLREGFHAALFAQGDKETVRGVMAGPSGELLSWVLRFLKGGRAMVTFEEVAPLALPAKEGRLAFGPHGRPSDIAGTATDGGATDGTATGLPPITPVLPAATG